MDSESSHQSRRRSRSLIWDLVRCDRLDNLCESLLIDILSRLPCRAAAQFKSVCKRWNSLISSDYFVRLFNHRRHDPESSAYTLVFVFHRPIPYYRFEDDCGPVARCSSGGAVLRVDKLDLSFLPPRPPSKIAVNASCDDLILCSSDEEPKPFYVCNLRTRQWVDLPPVDIPYPFANDYLVGFLCNPPPCSLCLGVKGGVDINKLEFMVVLIRHQIYRRRRSLINSGNGVSHIQVLLFSSEEGQWKSLTVSSPSRNLYGLEAVEGNVVPYKGKLHWLNYNDILVYDPYNDPTKLSRVIEMDFDHFDRVSLGVFQNRLRVASTTVNENPICHCVWELEDYEMEKWRLVHELENTSRNSPIIFMFHDGNALCWENEGSRVWLFNFQSVGVGQDHKYELVPPGLDHLLCEVYVHQIADHWWPTPLSSLSCHQGKSVSPPPPALPPLELDNAPQRLRGPAASVSPSSPTEVPPNDFSPLHTPPPMIRQDIVPSPPPMSSQGPVQVSPLSGPRSELPSTKHPVMAPQSPDDESPLKKPPPNSLLHAPIAPAPVEPTLRDLPPTMPPRPHETGSPQIAPTAAEPPSKKSSQNLPTRQRVVVKSSPQPSPREEGPPDTSITVPIAPATVQPPLGKLPQSPPSMEPVVTGSLPPSPYGRRALDTPPPVSVPQVPVEEPLRRSPPAMPPVETGPTSPREYGSTNAPQPMHIAPRTSATEQNRKRKDTPLGHSVKHAVSPFIPAAPVASPPSKVLGHTHPVHQRLHQEPPSSSPVKQDASTPLPSINGERVASPVAAPPNRLAHHDINAHTSPAKAPSTHKNVRHSLRHHFAKENKTASPLWHSVPPLASTVQGPSIAPVPSFASNSDPKSTLRHHIAHPPPSIAPVPLFGPSSDPKSNLRHHIAHPPSNSGPPPSSKISPSWSSARNPKMLFPHPFVLPPPPPNEDCSSLVCMEPFTTPPPKSSCDCALPMQIGLRLGVALYTFFPLVSRLAYEISCGVLMDRSQVRIMGANSANQYPEKTIVFIDLVPLGGQFDNTTAFLTFQNFWHKDVNISASFFGDYDVLYVRYPGLPPSPPSAPLNDGVISSDPYSGDNGRNIHPLGVDVTKRRHRGGPNRSLIAVIVLSASGAVILCCAVAWMLLFKHRDRVLESDPTPPATIPSLGKSPRVAASVTRSGPNSPSLSLSSSFVAYTGSAKTFSIAEIERVTDNFNEKRVLGEGGFGRVYSGALEDGTKVAVKVLKRDDHQGGREFFAEVEMLGRLHHRNVVNLIGICLEERARCLVYELVPNGSVESHLHGVDKERAPLDWNARVKIALGAARGLAYLHEDSSPRVIHRDFKSSNILLEHDFTPKVSDFGLARAAFDEENRHISTRVMGTFGYVAPEYAMTGHLLVKSDVYSYGVVLLELLTGRKPVDMSLPPGQENLVAWARPFLTTKEGLEFVVDASLGPDFPVDSVTKVAAIASMCVQPEVSHRPFMGEVVQALKLVCSETKDLETQNRDDQENVLVGRAEEDRGLAGVALNARSHRSNSDCEVDLERGHSMSDLLSPSMRYGIRECGSHGRSAAAGRRARRLWKKMRRLSGGSVSEHGVVFRLWPASN